MTAEQLHTDILKLIDGFAEMYSYFPQDEKEKLRQRLALEIIGKVKDWMIVEKELKA